MDANIVTLIVGIFGIVGTLTSSAIGFYFFYKERKSSYQELLFTEQLKLSKEAQKHIGYIKNIIPMLTTKYDAYNPEADIVAGNHLVDLANVANEGSAILPVDVWTELNQLVKEFHNFIGMEPQERTADTVRSLGSQTATFTIATRRMMGVDTLSVETYNLFTGTQNKSIMPEDAKNALLRK